MAEEEQNNSKMAGDGLKKGNHSTIVLMIRYKICTYLCMSMIKVHNICIFCLARAKSQLQVRRNCPNCFQYTCSIFSDRSVFSTLVVYFQTEVFSVELFLGELYTCTLSSGGIINSRTAFSE